MRSVFVARRRAEEFNSLVEADSTGVARGARFDTQLGLVTELREMPRPEPRAEFTADLRAELLAAADTLLLPTEDTARLTLPPPRTSRDRRIAVAVGGLAVVGASTSLAVAAQSALPGEMLYPLKRVIEQAETGIHSSNGARGQSLLANALDRLDEATALSRSGDVSDGPYVAQALLDFADQATAASDLLLADYDETGDEQSIEELRDFTADSMESLTVLEGMLPQEARDELRYAAQVIDEIDDAAAEACPSCAGGISQIPRVLLSAGQVAEPVVVVPSTLLPSLATEKDGTKATGGTQDGTKTGSKGGTTSTSPLPVDPLPGSTGGSDPTGGGGGPLGSLTNGLTGQGGANTSGGGGGGGNGGLTGVPEVDDTVDDVVDDLDGVIDDVGGILPQLP